MSRRNLTYAPKDCFWGRYIQVGEIVVKGLPVYVAGVGAGRENCLDFRPEYKAAILVIVVQGFDSEMVAREDELLAVPGQAAERKQSVELPDTFHAFRFV